MSKKQVSFGEAVVALKEGKRVQRSGWNGKGLFIFMQVASNIDVATVVPKMQSLPQSVKDEFARRQAENENSTDHFSIRYRNQLAMVYPDNMIFGWVASPSDVLENDWIILD